MIPRVICGCGGHVEVELTKVEEAPSKDGAMRFYVGLCDKCGSSCDLQMFVYP